MKIGYFTDSYAPNINGVATTVEELRKSIKNLNHEVFLVAPEYPGFKDKEKDIVRLKSFRFSKNPELRLAYLFPNVNLKDVLAYKYDLIHGFSGGPIVSLGLFLAKIRRVPYVFTYNTRYNQYTHYVLNGKLIKPKVVEVTVAVFCNQCSAIVAPSEFIKEELLSFGVKKPISVIPNGVNMEKFSSGNKDYLRTKLSLKSTDKIVLYLGRLAKEKSVDFIIKSFAHLAKNNSDSYLVIAGDGPLRKELVSLINKLNLQKRVIMFGQVEYDRVQDIYSGADVFTVAAQTETQGMYVYEALANGLPIVSVFDKAFINVIEDGVNGFALEKDEKKYAQKIQELLEDDELRFNFSKNALKKVKDFSLSEIAKKFDTLYKSLV